MDYENLKLTPIREDLVKDELDDHTTAGLVSFGLRIGGLESEYHLALRTEKLREVAFRLAKKLMEEGYGVGDSDLKLIDVSAEVTTIETKRFA
jgi:hypothetical protein